MSLLMYQRLEPTGENNGSFENMGGLYVQMMHIEAAVPMEKLIKIESLAGIRYESHSVTELHMKSGTKHLIPQSISEVLEDINVPI